MTDETVECFNCGRANPEWAQVCRSCGVPLRHGQPNATPAGPFPTDRNSLISIGSVIATILAAVLLGVFVSSLNPSDPSLALATPSPSATPEATVEPSETPVATPSATPAPTPVPLPGTLAFGNELDADGRVVEEVDTFTPSMTFAYSVEVADGFGADQIFNEVVRVDDALTVVLPREGVGVNAEATVFGYVVGPASNFVTEWGPGEYAWRVYIGDELVARKRFHLADG
jgi:hypothetical protein